MHFLVEKGVDVNSSGMLCILIIMTVCWFKVDSGGLSLYNALDNGHLQIAHFLVEKGMDINSSGMPCVSIIMPIHWDKFRHFWVIFAQCHSKWQFRNCALPVWEWCGHWQLRYSLYFINYLHSLRCIQVACVCTLPQRMEIQILCTSWLRKVQMLTAQVLCSVFL